MTNPESPAGSAPRAGRSATQDEASAKRVIAALSAFVVVAVAVVLAAVPRHTVTLGAGPDALATINATLNGGSALGLVLGFIAIKRRRIELHRACMMTSFVLSSVFLVTYLAHHARVGSVPYGGHGLMRTVYFAVLVPHVILAAVIVPMALTTLRRGWIRDLARHRAIARVTLPLWLYVSVSGVVLYFMLYF